MKEDPFTGGPLEDGEIFSGSKTANFGLEMLGALVVVTGVFWIIPYLLEQKNEILRHKISERQLSTMTQNHAQGTLPFSKESEKPLCLACEEKDKRIKELEARIVARDERMSRLFRIFGEIGPPKDH